MPRQKCTDLLLKQFRALMRDCKYCHEPLNAYIIPSCDAHNSEYLAECDQRRVFVSGFTGSAGTAIVTEHEACLWTDGRYYLQAETEMDSNWTLMKEGTPSTPTQGTWLSKVLPKSSNVGIDPNLITHGLWAMLQAQLESAGHRLLPIQPNLVDLIWSDKPNPVRNPIVPLSLRFSGKTAGTKLDDVRKTMQEKNVEVLVVTALDEVAWLLNLRGSDIEYNPVFFAYAIVLSGSLILCADLKQVTPQVSAHLREEIGSGDGNFTIEPYDQIVQVLKKILRETKGGVLMSENASYSLTSNVPKNRLKIEITPIALMKAIKNPVEIEGMKKAHIKDAAALCCYFSWLESVVGRQPVTEITAAKKLDSFRQLQKDYVGPSFETISSIGPHGAIIHYKPEPETDAHLDDKSLYLCDSGGQYLDGTTDVTRTMHFGLPTDYEKDCYTRVLKGQLRLASSVFPTKIVGNCLDSFARQYLWEIGLDYAHGTGHGIGSYLNVHEGPMGISWRCYPDDPGLSADMFLSNEPGYYENGRFGIRIEDIVHIVPAKTTHNFNERGYLTFETITLVPKQTKMVKAELLTRAEIDALNKYHVECREVVGPILDEQGQVEAKRWLLKETEPLAVHESTK